MITLEIEYLSGVCYASRGPEGGADWPPQPDRIFSALVATWAAHGKPERETRALEWLETLPPPKVVASPSYDRTAVTCYVPPNDASSSRKAHALDVVPSFRHRQAREFPATRPENPLLRILWQEGAPDSELVNSLDSLAKDTSYVGHSTSLTRCRAYVVAGDIPPEAITVTRSVYPGRLNQLVQAFEAGRRPTVGDWVTPEPAAKVEGWKSSFSDDWLVFELITKRSPDIRVAALMAKGIRERISEGYRALGLDVPEVLSGRSSDGKPSAVPHVAVVPLAFAGFPHADGRLLGFAVVPPAGSGLLRDADWLAAVRRVAPVDETLHRRVMKVHVGAERGDGPGVHLELSPTYEASRRSLDPALYFAPNQEGVRTWATLTPIVLDKHLKRNPRDLDAIVQQVAEVCRRGGLPEVEWEETAKDRRPHILVSAHSSLEGSRSVVTSKRAPASVHWQVPDYLAGRRLVHAVLRFSKPVRGPVFIGAGRYLGLGICRPVVQGKEGAENADN